MGIILRVGSKIKQNYPWESLTITYLGSQLLFSDNADKEKISRSVYFFAK